MKTNDDIEQQRITLNGKLVSAKMVADAKMRIVARAAQKARIAAKQHREAVAKILAR